MKVCDIKGCGGPLKARGLCDMHYSRLRRENLPLPGKVGPWTKEVKALVAGMLLEELSASQIAVRLRPGVQVTRNAVVGVVHRDPILRAIGLRGGSGAPHKPHKAPRIKKSRIPGVLAAPKRRRFSMAPLLSGKQYIHHIGDHVPDFQDWCEHPPKLHKLPKPDRTVFECRSVPLLDLNRGECKWPVNDAAIGELHLFCGNPADGSYCRSHARLGVGYGTRSEKLADQRNKPDFRRAA